MGASCGGHGSADYRKVGLESNHAYSILDVCCLDVDGSLRLLRLRNPWGKFAWKGKWSDCDLVWERNSFLKQVLNNQGGGEGIFWIEFSDFMR